METSIKSFHVPSIHAHFPHIFTCKKENRLVLEKHKYLIYLSFFLLIYNPGIVSAVFNAAKLHENLFLLGGIAFSVNFKVLILK